MKNKQGILYLIPKGTYYNSKNEVLNEAIASHEKMFKEDRELYTYLMYFTNSTYFSKSLIIENILKNSLFKPENKAIVDNDNKIIEIENALITHTLFNENITHALKVLLRLKDQRINNNRTSKIILEFLFKRGNIDMISIKYKNKVKDLLIHALGLSTIHKILNRESEGMRKFNKLIRIYNNPYDFEVIEFVFDKKSEFRSAYFKEYVQVREMFKTNTVNLSKKTEIPIEVLEGFNSFYKRNINLASLFTVANVSDKQKIQKQNTVIKHSNDMMEIKIDLTKYSILDLFKYMYNKKDITVNEVNECNAIINQKAQDIRLNLENNEFFVNLENTAVIVDCSDSSNGSKETKLHPLFKKLAMARIFKSSIKDNIILVGGNEKENGLVYPMGDTNLSKGLLESVKRGFENVLVLSDGFENVGSFDKVYKQLKSIGFNINAIHFNPVFSPKNFSFKEISDDIIAIPYTDVNDVENLVSFYYLNSNPEKFKEILRKRIVTEILNK